MVLSMRWVISMDPLTPNGWVVDSLAGLTYAFIDSLTYQYSILGLLLIGGDGCEHSEP